MTDSDTLRTSFIGEAAAMLARFWVQHIRPVSYRRVFYVDNVRVRVEIGEYENNLEELMSDRSTDA